MLDAQTTEAAVEDEAKINVIPLTQFVADFGDGLLEAVSRLNPPVYDGNPSPQRNAVMDGLKRDAFLPQREAVQALAKLLVDENQPAAILNGEMGTGKTMMGIALAAILQQAEGYGRVLVIAPPHLVYKWRREILNTIAGAKVTVLNGPATLGQLLKLRMSWIEGVPQPKHEFFVLGRVRMRMGFHWRTAFAVRASSHRPQPDPQTGEQKPAVPRRVVCCPKCYHVVQDADGNPYAPSDFPSETRLQCVECREPLWTLIRPRGQAKGRTELLIDSLCQIPTIGRKTAERLVNQFGEGQLIGMLDDNVHEFVNLMDGDGDLVFTDRQAKRMERSMANLEFSFGQGGYQPTEFVKRYLPGGYFDLLLVDEGHEYKNEGSAQGQAMAVLVSKVRKAVLLTGTLMGGYADDLLHLLWRVMPERMIEDGYRYQRRSLGTAAMSFMRHHGVLKDIYRETDGPSHKTAKGKRTTVRTVKAPGFGPKGIARYVLPFTVFLKLKDIGADVLPPYREHFEHVAMTAEQKQYYEVLQSMLTAELRQAMRKGDKTLMGVVLNTLLAWPSCCFREETVRHPRTRILLAETPALFTNGEVMPMEERLIALVKANKLENRRVLAYTTYTGKRDTTSRLKAVLEREGLRPAVLRASVDPSKREDWLAEQVDRGCDVVITNPELVKTGLDMLEFPTIAFMQTGYNVYTMQQAARRSWRIGQKFPVDVHFFGYADTTQIRCLQLMASKIAVSQSTSGDMPDTGLDVLNQDDDSIEVALAKQLLN